MRVFRSDSLCQRSKALAVLFVASITIAHASDMWPRVTLEDETQLAYLDEDAQVFVLTSGHRVPATDSSGRRGILADEDEVTYPDGSRFLLNPKTGELRFGNLTSGRRIYFGRRDSRFAGYRYNADKDTITTPHGFQIRPRTPDGSLPWVTPRNGIHYADGSSVVTDGVGITFHSSDGTSSQTYLKAPGVSESGARFDEATQSIITPAGEAYPLVDAAGNRGYVNEKGDVAYSDGSFIDVGGHAVADPVAGGRIFFKESGSGPGGVSYDEKTDSFTTAAGLNVPGRDPKGDPGWVNDKGDITYDNGVLVTSDGTSTTTSRPDGSSLTYFHGTGKTTTGVSYDSSSGMYRTRAGHSVPGIDSKGTPAVVNDKGDILFGDGTIVTGDENTTTIITPDGRSGTFFGDGKSGYGPGGVYHDGADDTLTTPEGHTFPGRDRDSGRPARIGADGSIQYDDRTVNSNNKHSWTVTHDDGSSETYFAGTGNGPAGTYYDAKSDEFITSTGHHLPGTDRDGVAGWVNEKGDIEYADGTIVVTDPKDGSITIVHGSGNGTTTIKAGETTGTRSGGSSDDSDDSDGSGDSGSSGDGGSDDDSADDDSSDDESGDDGSSEEGTEGDEGDNGDDGDGGEEDPDTNTEGTGGGSGTGPSTEADAFLEARRNLGRGGRDEGTPPWLTGCGPDRQPVIGPDGTLAGCTGVPDHSPSAEGDDDDDESEPGEIWIWPGPSGGIDDPLGPVVQPGDHEDSGRGGLRTEPIFQRLEQLTDPPEH